MLNKKYNYIAHQIVKNFGKKKFIIVTLSKRYCNMSLLIIVSSYKIIYNIIIYLVLIIINITHWEKNKNYISTLFEI